MYRLSLIAAFICLLSVYVSGQSPHGKGLTIDCAKCHSPESWNFDKNYSTFNHDSTRFELTGSHTSLECRSCHTSLEFEKVQNDCISCHTDFHKQTVGNDCARCHTTDSWIVQNITTLHERTSFPLIGVHATIDCNQCHQTETNLQFEPKGLDCYSCHNTDYVNTKKPSHVKNGFSTDCAQCHSTTNGFEWSTELVDHSFFPLTGGHAINNCAACHDVSDFSKVSADCFSCHEKTFFDTKNPDHNAAGFNTDCMQCHTTDPDWRPVNFLQHDAQSFPIYSGKHKGVWVNCNECHTSEGNFGIFSCTACHKDPETTTEHSTVSGFKYEDNACFACHPTGDAGQAFNHDATAFPLTGVHRTTDCVACHANGYKGTPTQCRDCHITDFNNTKDPNHIALGINQDCASCHTTNIGWQPASFTIHDQYYLLNGIHKTIANDCAKCHNGTYANTPNTCIGCHTGDFTSAKEPDHLLNGISNDCASCHNENAWQPSTFSHDGFFPVFSGKHNNVWVNCNECHTQNNNFSTFDCLNCHKDPVTTTEHSGVSGYVYESNACFGCHPLGDATNAFNHNSTAFPLTGAHTTVSCVECHANGFENTSTNCIDCHTQNFNGAKNPDHSALNFSKECVTCHTTTPGWAPASFANHDEYYVLKGFHVSIKNDCVACHQGNYNNTPNTCAACHISDYNATTNPNHISAQFPTDCTSCHSESAWQPSNFNHDGQFFPIYSGKHNGVWTQCIDCHNNAANYAEVNCITCHQNPETNTQHTGVGGYVYNSPACLACHPTGDADVIFDHNTTSFPLTGVHNNVDCIQCHNSGFENTSTNCVDCHLMDFNQAVNPSHTGLNISQDCASCHNTNTPGWAPATFSTHNQYYPLNGAHTFIANDCATCHQGNYTTTPNTCNGCHNADYTATNNPNHIQAQFPTDCATCHSESSWTPTTFNHDGQFFPIYSGNHNGVWTQCIDCHSNATNYSVVNCTTCHQNPETNEQHPGVNGYVYSSPACLACHPQGEATGSFNHSSTNFPLTGGHLGVDCISCHANGYQGTTMVCQDCHITQYNQSVNPNHVALGIPTDCITCHTTAPGWAPASFAIHNNYYPLTGGHNAIANDCAQCHIGGNYNNTPTDCNGCHNTDYTATLNPNHVALGLSTDCVSCHTTASGWAPAQFNIHSTVWPLTGAHATVACVECHIGGNYNNTPIDCNGCHNTDYTTATNPNHASLGLSTDCITCHTTASGWAPANFAIHNNFYPLTGAHATVNCNECHVGGNYTNTQTTCNGCHSSDYTTATNPNHVTLNLSTDCVSCHTTASGWAPANFVIHNNFYPLTGAHATVNCNDCHVGGNYTNTPTTCNGCHSSDYTTATNPNHVALNLSTDCVSCHTTAPGWAPATFAIHNTVYPLTGAHIGINCNECHINGNYSTTPTTCNGCHTSDYTTATNPNHVALGLSTDCVSCHSTAPGWAPATFAIHNNYYPLSGAHVGVDCAQCHLNGNYNSTPTDCNGCHNNDYIATNNPDHQSLNIPITCVDCHTTNPGWMPATFAIHNNYYPLEGAHATINCNQCHTNGTYSGTPNTCIGCHQSEYNGTNNPNHASAGFPNDCTICHNQNAWTPSNWDHDGMYFPIFSGKHDGQWNNCNECHTTPNNYMLFNCLNCHQQGPTNNDHQGVSGYQYNSNACFTCHPQGEG
jgi:hypothetical protein